MPRLIRRYRRPLAFLLAFLGVLVALSSMRERPDTWQATVVATDLAGGHVLTAADLRTAAASAGTRPTTAVGHPDDAIGRVLAGPVAAGEILSEHRLIGPSLLDGSPPGHVAIPITLDPIFAGLAWSLIFGLLVSTAFTLLVVPVAYYRVYVNRPGHGLPRTRAEGGGLA